MTSDEGRLLELLRRNGRTLGSLLPAEPLLGRLADASLPRRLVAALKAQSITTWEEAARTQLPVLLDEPRIGVPGVLTLVEAADEGVRAVDGREAERPSAILDVDSSFGAQWSSALDGLGASLGLVDERKRTILRERILAVDAPEKLSELGNRLGVTRERVRQIEAELRSALGSWRANRTNQWAVRQAMNLREQLGSAFPVAASEASRVLEPIRGDRDKDGNFARELVLWLAGPYLKRDGWLLTAEADRLRKEFARFSYEASEDGVIVFGRVRRALEDAGVSRDFHVAWMQQQPGVRRIGQAWVRWDGTALDKAERLLRMRGNAATIEDIFADIEEPPPNLRQRLTRDPRFVRASKDEFALTDWGVEAYTTIADRIIEELQLQGGIASVSELVRTVSRKYSVSPNSVRSYLAAPLFIRANTGVVRFRRPDEKYVPRTKLPEAPDCYVVDGRWSWRVEVNGDVQRGSGRNLPAAFASHLGLEPGGKQMMTSDVGDIVITWLPHAHTGPIIG